MPWTVQEASRWFFLSNFERRRSLPGQARAPLAAEMPKYETPDYGFVRCTLILAATSCVEAGLPTDRETARISSGNSKGFTM